MARKKHTDEAPKAAESATQVDKSSAETAGAKPRGRPFPRGQSGNPKGRPKTRWELKERIQRRGDDLVDALFDIVDDLPRRYEDEEGDGSRIVGPSHRDRIAAISLLKAYGYGKPTEHVELSGPAGAPIAVQSVGKMTSGQKRKRLAELLAKMRKAPADGSPPASE